MPITLLCSVQFGAAKTGLSTVAYRLYNPDGTPHAAIVTTGISERGSGTGTYAAQVTFDDAFIATGGELRWNSGDSPLKQASAFYSNGDFAQSSLGDLITALTGGYVQSAVNEPTPSAASFIGGAGLSSVDHFYRGSYLAFRSGSLNGIARGITAYNGTTKRITFESPFPSNPANGDAFFIAGRMDEVL